jgi:hypothetical protein
LIAARPSSGLAAGPFAQTNTVATTMAVRMALPRRLYHRCGRSLEMAQHRLQQKDPCVAFTNKPYA